MHADILLRTAPSGPEPTRCTDYGLDSQYQWIGDVHAITARASYIYERQQL